MAGRGGKRSTSFKPGNRANPGGRPKAIISLVELARTQTEESIRTLVQVRDDANAPAAARASRGSTFSSAHSCLSVTISIFAGLSFIDRPPISVGDRY